MRFVRKRPGGTGPGVIQVVPVETMEGIRKSIRPSRAEGPTYTGLVAHPWTITIITVAASGDRLAAILLSVSRISYKRFLPIEVLPRTC